MSPASLAVVVVVGAAVVAVVALVLVVGVPAFAVVVEAAAVELVLDAPVAVVVLAASVVVVVLSAETLLLLSLPQAAPRSARTTRMANQGRSAVDREVRRVMVTESSLPATRCHGT
jgi:hypothetical protein